MLLVIHTIDKKSKNMFKVEKNLYINQLFYIIKNWDKIEYEIGSTCLIYKEKFKNSDVNRIIGLLGDEEGKKLVDAGIGEPITVTLNEFIEFLKNNKNDFDISDNQHAEYPSYGNVAVKG